MPLITSHLTVNFSLLQNSMYEWVPEKKKLHKQCTRKTKIKIHFFFCFFFFSFLVVIFHKFNTTAHMQPGCIYNATRFKTRIHSHSHCHMQYNNLVVVQQNISCSNDLNGTQHNTTQRFSSRTTQLQIRQTR